MSVEAFLDTNVLVYAAAGSDEESVKRRQALRLIDDLDFGLSAQVLQEFYVTVVHKLPAPLSAAEALEWIEQLEAFPCQAIEAEPRQDRCRTQPALPYQLLGRSDHRRGWRVGCPNPV